MRRKQAIILIHDRCVAVENDWRPQFAVADSILRGIFNVNGHDYFADGKPLAPGSPKILSVVAP